MMLVLEHNRVRAQCNECGGASICIHPRYLGCTSDAHFAATELHLPQRDSPPLMIKIQS